MNELLAQAYGTGQAPEAEIEKTAEAALLDELEKVAAEEGINLSELSDDDIVEILGEALGAGTVGDVEKTASEETVESADEQVKLAEADFLGRTMAHAFYQELQSIQDSTQVKEASEEVVATDDFESAAMERAEAMLSHAANLVEEAETQEKTSSVQQYLAEKLASKTQEDTSDDALTARALEILDANDYDVEVITNLLSQ